MTVRSIIWAAAAAALTLSGCATNGAATTPTIPKANLSQNVLTFAVGTANIAADGVTGLNVVATLRQPDGLSGVLADTPTITGPSGFTVPAGLPSAYSNIPSAGSDLDAGTNHISGSQQVPLNNAGLVNTTLGTFTGVFAYGLGPLNSDQQAVTGYFPGNPNASGGNGFESSAYAQSTYWALPLGSANAVTILGGPPAYPFFNDGVSAPQNFAGYSQGFVPFEVTPTTGTYTLDVLVPAQNTSPVTYSATASLTNATPLAAPTVASFVEDGNGGGSGTVTIPDARTTETMVYVHDTTANLFFSVLVKGTGTQTFTLPSNLGKCAGLNCENGSGATPSIAAGDTYAITAVSYDYPAFEAGDPNGLVQKPVITGSGGQADLAMSLSVSGTY